MSVGNGQCEEGDRRRDENEVQHGRISRLWVQDCTQEDSSDLMRRE
jgi:hypothetical protein